MWLQLVPTAELKYTSEAPLLIFKDKEFDHFYQRAEGSYSDHIYTLMHPKNDANCFL